MDIQRFSHLDIPTQYQSLTSIRILIPTVSFFDTIDCWYCAFTYIPDLYSYVSPYHTTTYIYILGLTHWILIRIGGS